MVKVSLPGVPHPDNTITTNNLLETLSQGAKKSALVGMSGGADSAVAAGLLKRAGWEVVGVTLRLWSDPACTDPRTGGTLEAQERASSVARLVGVPHLVVDAQHEFYRTVVRYFIEEYASGRTPNPCCKCNARFRFRLFADIARSLGLEWVATGHYARIAGDPWGLARGIDRQKDQSYVLAEVAPELLERCLFPLGGLLKTEVQSYAEEWGLANVVSQESQEICFIPDDDYRRFLRAHLGERPGLIVDRGGRVLGQHRAVYDYTVGQRRGLKLDSAGRPLYVVEIMSDRATVVVGESDEALVREVRLGGVVSHRAPRPGPVEVQLRSNGGTARATLRGLDRVVLSKPVCGVAPGQTAVVYQEGLVVLAGTILSTLPGK